MSGTYNDETGGHGGDLARAAQKWGYSKEELVDFSSNINPLGPPPGLLEHLGSLLPNIVAYPTPQARELRAGLAEFLRVPVERLLLGNGANELIHLILLWNRPKRVFIPAPSFSEYERAAKLAGAAVEYYSLLPGEEDDFTRLAGRLNHDDMLVFCNPNNPTGILYPRSKLAELVREAGRRRAAVMIDESFVSLTGRPEESLRDLEVDNLWLVISLTKLWGLPGLRLGCALGPIDKIGKITGWGDPWRVNYLAQEAGLFCLSAEGYLEESLALIKEELRYLIGELKATGAFEVFEGAANYLLLKGLDPAFDINQFQDFLARRGVLVRRADNFNNLDRRYFRIAVRRRQENQRLLREIKAWLESGTQGGSALDSGGVK